MWTILSSSEYIFEGVLEFYIPRWDGINRLSLRKGKSKGSAAEDLSRRRCVGIRAKKSLVQNTKRGRARTFWRPLDIASSEELSQTTSRIFRHNPEIHTRWYVPKSTPWIDEVYTQQWMSGLNPPRRITMHRDTTTHNHRAQPLTIILSIVGRRSGKPNCRGSG